MAGRNSRRIRYPLPHKSFTMLTGPSDRISSVKRRNDGNEIVQPAPTYLPISIYIHTYGVERKKKKNGRNFRCCHLLTGQYCQAEQFAVSHALLAKKHACLCVHLLYSRLRLQSYTKFNINATFTDESNR